jgi:hypothetical protein
MIKSGNKEVNMIIVNETNFSETSIKAVATWAGLDLSEGATLVIKRVLFNKPNMKGSFHAYQSEAGLVYVVELAAAGCAKVLAHELRHAAQCQALTLEVFNTLYDLEEQLEGYKLNVFEVDAREYMGDAA